MKKYNRVLTIAGSDSGGGAGIQADIKTISACGCYAASAITAVTVQNTLGVEFVEPLPLNVVAEQIDAVLTDIGADCVKIGMLHSSDVVSVVVEQLQKHNVSNIVLDPVMVSTSGHRLIEQSAIQTLCNSLIPISSVITPNIPEAEILYGRQIPDQESLYTAAEMMGEKFHVSVYLKAGHLSEDDLVDIFYNYQGKNILELKSSRRMTKNTHGTGCTLSSALASGIAKGMSMREAAVFAHDYVAKAILAGAEYEIGGGHGPVHHFFNFWE